MKTFEEALSSEMKRHRADLDSQGCSYREQLRCLIWFKEGVRWASNSPEQINEILTKYMQWAENLPANIFDKWGKEEDDYKKTKERIRKEFIEYLNSQK